MIPNKFFKHEQIDSVEWELIDNADFIVFGRENEFSGASRELERQGMELRRQLRDEFGSPSSSADVLIWVAEPIQIIVSEAYHEV